MESQRRDQLTIDSFLSAAECNAQREMSLPKLIQQLLDISTAHANFLGCGYARLIEDNNAWVLSRCSVELDHLPRINEPYSMTTWVEDVNRHYSERIVEIRAGADNEVIGYGRLVWVAINIDTRRPADLTPILPLIEVNPRRCPIERFPRLTPIGTADHTSTYQFRYSDIDFNRHVNSTRYVEFMLNQWDVDFFDAHTISRFDIAYIAEAHYNDVVEVRRKGDDSIQDFEIARDGAVCTRARIHFSPRQPEA